MEVTTEVVARVAPKYYFGLDGEEDDHLRVNTYVLDYFHELNLLGGLFSSYPV